MIAALVVNYRCAGLTARAVDSVYADCPGAEVVVVDNSACDEEAQRLRDTLPPGVQLIIAPENLGFGAANELALAASSGDPVLLLNPDAHVLSGCISRLVDTLARGPGVGAVSPLVWWNRKQGFALPPGQMESPLWELWRAISQRSALLHAVATLAFRARSLRIWKAREPVPVSMLSGAVMMLSRAAIAAAGGLFDRRFFMFYEDTDLSRRLRAAGLSLLVDPCAGAIHTWRADSHKSLLMADGRRCYMEKYFRDSAILRLAESMHLASTSRETAHYTDLGVAKKPPILTVRPPWRSSWLLEISSAPSLIPATGLLGTGAEIGLPDEWWRNLAPSRYFARLGRAGWITRPQYFSWQVADAASESANSGDLLGALSDTLVAPAGVTVTLGAKFPRPSLALAKRFGLKPIAIDSALYLKDRQPTWRIAWARPEDEAALRELFAAAFGNNMPSRHWQWKYGDRSRFGIAVWRGDRAVAYYGWMQRRLQFFGVPVEAAQVSDVMTRPEERGMLSREGPFSGAALTFVECCLGDPPRYSTAFGFPSARHARLGARLGIYHEASRIVDVRWPCRRLGKSLAWKIRVMSGNPGDSAIADALWKGMAQSLMRAVVGQRDAAYLRYRYFDHPVTKYIVLLVRQRWTMRPWGMVVLRDHDAWMELVDLVAPVPRMQTLIGTARRFAGNAGKTELRGWITEEFAGHFAAPDANVMATDITVPLAGFAPTLARRSRGRWFLMAGDADFH